MDQNVKQLAWYPFSQWKKAITLVDVSVVGCPDREQQLGGSSQQGVFNDGIAFEHKDVFDCS